MSQILCLRCPAMRGRIKVSPVSVDTTIQEFAPGPLHGHGLKSAQNKRMTMNTRSGTFALFLLPMVGLWATQSTAGPTADPPGRSAELTAALGDFKRPLKVPVPKTNPLTA